jgi:DNA repair exonuclease SbcCD ATPase subunit
VERVVNLLIDLKSKVESEGSAEASTYDTFACFCKDTNNEKVDSISSGEESSNSLSANLKAKTALAAELTADIARLNAELDGHEASLAKATALRNKERAVYEEMHADTSAAVSGLGDAITAIKGSKAFVEIKKKVQRAIALADVVGMSTGTKDQVTQLLQAIPEVPANDYNFHSEGIVDLLTDLKNTWSEKKQKLENEEQASGDAFNAAAEAKRGEIQAAKASIDTQSTSIEETKQNIAQTEADLTETNALLADDRTYLKDLTEQCERKAREWDQRASTRKNELEALSAALQILSDKVLDKETASGAGGRPSVLTQTPAKAVLLVAEDEYSDVAFIQRGEQHNLKEVHEHSSTALVLRNKAITMLKRQAKKLQSTVLSVAAMKLAADPFAKIKGLLQSLITRLLSEATDEASQKGWCDTEIAKANHDRDYRHADAESLSANIKVLEAREASLTEKVAELKQQITDLNEAFTSAETRRSNEKAENKATLDAATDGLAALKDAIQVLKDFYRNAKKPSSTNYLQVKAGASPVDQDLASAGSEHRGAYQGSQAQAHGILGMLATIQSDFERTISETTAAEEAAHRDFVAFDRETKASLRSKQRGLEQTENDNMLTKNDLVSDLNNLKDQQSLLDQSLRTLETLRPACVDTGMTWDERVARRDAEIQALKDALCVLDETDNDIPECGGGKLFLQR